MKLNLPFIVLIASAVGAVAENATSRTSNVTKRPTRVVTTTTPQPNFISSTLDVLENIRKFFFSEFFSRITKARRLNAAEAFRTHRSVKSRRSVSILLCKRRNCLALWALGSYQVFVLHSFKIGIHDTSRVFQVFLFNRIFLPEIGQTAKWTFLKRREIY